MDSKRDFLGSLSLLDELLELEEESGNHLEAVNIAKMMGNILREADLLEKIGRISEAYELVFFYVLSNSLWSGGSKAWPLKHFTQKAELLGRALTFAEKESSRFHELASTEAEILSNKHDKNCELMNQLNSCHVHKSIRGEILCLWKLLDSHFGLNSAKYVWHDNLFDVSVKGMIKKNQLSVESLFYCWTCWKDKIVRMLEYLSNFQPEDDNNYVKFAINYLGVQKQSHNPGDRYLLLIHDANWIKNLDDDFLKKDGRVVTIDFQALVSYAKRYWSSELSSVGMHVLRVLDALNKFSDRKGLSELWQRQSLLRIYEVSKFLLKSDCFKLLEKYKRKSIDIIGRHVIPLDWEKSLKKEMVCQRTSNAWQAILKEVIYDNTTQKGRLTDNLIGRLVVMILGAANVEDELFLQVKRKFEANTDWALFIENLRVMSFFHIGSSLVEKDCMRSFYKALKNTCSVNWMGKIDCVTPGCFMYLVERLLLWISCWKGHIYATKSSFTEWVIWQNEIYVSDLTSRVMEIGDVSDVYEFLANTLNLIVCDQAGTKSWIKKSDLNVKNYFPMLVLRMVVSICLLHISSGRKKYLQMLRNLLGMKDIIAQLPLEFCKALERGEENMTVRVYAKAFKVIGNPLVIAKLWDWKGSSKIVLPDNAVYVDLSSCQEKKLILENLYSSKVDNMDSSFGDYIYSSGEEIGSVSTEDELDFHINVECHTSQSNNSQSAVNSEHGKGKQG